MIKRLLLALLISSLGGCVNLGGGANEPPRQVYVLVDAPAAPATIPVVRPYTLLIEDTDSSSYDNNSFLVFSRSLHTRSHYQYAHWSELPSVRWSELLFNRLANTHIYASVVSANSDVSAERHLSTNLLSFYHDATNKPGFVHVVLRAQLYDSQHQRLIARRVFVQNTPLTSYNAAGAAAAFNQASHAILDDLTRWLASAEDGS